MTENWLAQSIWNHPWGSLSVCSFLDTSTHFHSFPGEPWQAMTIVAFAYLAFQYIKKAARFPLSFFVPWLLFQWIVLRPSLCWISIHTLCSLTLRTFCQMIQHFKSIQNQLSNWADFHLNLCFPFNRPFDFTQVSEPHWASIFYSFPWK